MAKSNFEITFNWDTLRDGKFPFEELKQMDDNCEIVIEKSNTFNQKITFKTNVGEDNHVQVAFYLGRIVQGLIKN
jgi:hypothetical protein